MNIDNEGDAASRPNKDNDVDKYSEHRRRRVRHYEERERVKQDILHVFLRFEKVLSKEYSAYKSLRLALRDARYVLNQDDLDSCLKVLKIERISTEIADCRETTQRL